MRLASIALALFAAGCTCGGATVRSPASVLGAQPRVLLRADGGVPAVDGGFEEFSLWIATNADPESIQVRCDQLECAVLQRIAHPAAPVGAVALVIDDSGSNTAAATVCVGCPTDPDGVRKEAAKRFFRRLFDTDDAYRAALFEFGPSQPNADFISTHMVAGYTRYPEDLVTGADRLKSAGGTYVYDAVWDVAPTVAGEALALDAGTGVLKRLLLVSDGEDTHSTKFLPNAVAQAVSLGVVVDTIGYGRSDGGATPLLVGKAFRDLRLIASVTGGFSAFTQTAELPALLEAVAESYQQGSVELRVGMPAGVTSVSGTATADGRELRFSF